jgi:hypothetical protein
MNTIRTSLALTLLLIAAISAASAQGGVSVMPAGVSVRGSAGATTTQHFTLTNNASLTYLVKVDVADVLINDGQRTFIPAGRMAGGLADRTFPAMKQFELPAGAEADVPVTFVLPSESDSRAVAVFFHAEPSHAPASGPRIRLNIGAVVDFTVTDKLLINAAEPQIALPTATRNLAISEHLTNVGGEPFIARGMAVILDPHGRLVIKAPFTSKRLLPREHNVLLAQFGGTLPSGNYRALCTVEYSGKTITHESEFIVP